MNKSTTTVAVQANPEAGVVTKRASRKGHLLAERGMATAEYAVGILAAVALALVLIKVFNAGSFLDLAMKLITNIFDKILGWLPK
ncbi:MAG: DUF4244 domain-containing protein [Propionibacteriaceae bacterium]|nr:DUF4244 domain-containing protein [Propionibacteriaceae bacterium]